MIVRINLGGPAFPYCHQSRLSYTGQQLGHILNHRVTYFAPIESKAKQMILFENLRSPLNAQRRVALGNIPSGLKMPSLNTE